MAIPAVHLHREVEVAPEEVDLETEDLGVRLEAGDPGVAQEAQHAPFATGAGALRPARQLKDLAERAGAALVLVALELVAKLGFGREPSVLRLRNRALGGSR